jgi:hypothetical protein
VKFATWQGAAAQDARPAFDLIEPAAMGRNKLEIHVGMSFEPAVLFGLVSVEIVQDAVEPFAGCLAIKSFTKSRNSRLRRICTQGQKAKRIGACASWPRNRESTPAPWRASGSEHELKPHRQKSFKLARDGQFVERLLDVVGIYLNPPHHVVVLCTDEKSQIEALDRTQPGSPLKKVAAHGSEPVALCSEHLD